MGFSPNEAILWLEEYSQREYYFVFLLQLAMLVLERRTEHHHATIPRGCVSLSSRANADLVSWITGPHQGQHFRCSLSTPELEEWIDHKETPIVLSNRVLSFVAS